MRQKQNNHMDNNSLTWRVLAGIILIMEDAFFMDFYMVFIYKLRLYTRLPKIDALYISNTFICSIFIFACSEVALWNVGRLTFIQYGFPR